MTPYQNVPPMGSQPGYRPPEMPRPQPNPAYIAERRLLRQSANYFGIAAILYFVVNISASLLLSFLIQLSYQFTGRQLFGNSEVSYYLLNMGVYILSFTVAFGVLSALFENAMEGCGSVSAGGFWNNAAQYSRQLCSFRDRFYFDLYFIFAVRGVTGYQPVTSDITTPVTLPGLVLYFALLAVLPPIFEEIAFRGILMQSLRRFGDGFALLISALLFGLFHLNMVQAPYAFLLGLWFGYLVLRTGSLRISMVLHACINLSAGVMSILMNGMGEDMLVLVNLIYIVFWITTGVASVLFLILRTRGPLGLYPAQTWMRTGQKVGVYFSSVAMIVALLAIFFFMIQNFVRVA